MESFFSGIRTDQSTMKLPIVDAEREEENPVRRIKMIASVVVLITVKTEIRVDEQDSTIKHSRFYITSNFNNLNNNTTK